MQTPDLLRTEKRWLVDGLDFVVQTAQGLAIRGRFDRVGGAYEVGPDGRRIELAVDVASIDTGSGIWDGLLRSANSRRLDEHPEVRFRSTRVHDRPDGTLRVEGHLDAAGSVQPVAFDAALRELDRRLQLEAATTLDRQQLGQSVDRFASFLPATLRLTVHLRP